MSMMTRSFAAAVATQADLIVSGDRKHLLHMREGIALVIDKYAEKKTKGRKAKS